MKKLIQTFICLALLSFNLAGQSIVNGDLDGVIIGTSSLPISWTSINWDDVNCLADPGGTTPDLTSTTEPSAAAGIIGTPYAGDTFVSASYGQIPGSTFFHEGIQQNVSGFSIGVTYTIRYYQSIIKTLYCADTSGTWTVILDDMIIGTPAVTESLEPFNSISNTWEMRSVSFMATESSYDLKFLPADDDENQIATIDDQGGCLHIGIDSISIISCNSSSTDTLSACSSYTWIDGNTYTTSDYAATYALTNEAGCDSIVTLNLTINANTGTDVQSACSSYTWIDGNTYTTSDSTATYTLTNEAGCDSVVTLNLIINTASTGNDVQTACDSYTWIDGNTYTTSDSTATYTLSNEAGCDSVVTLNLTINNVDSSVNQEGNLLTANETGATYQWLNCPDMTPIIGANSQSYSTPSNGDFAVIVTNNGCADTSDCYTVRGVGILENTFRNKILIYPNPTKGNLSLDLGDYYESVTITITDFSGKLIRSETFYESQILILKLHEPKGIYLLTVESEDKKAVIRLTKE